MSEIKIVETSNEAKTKKTNKKKKQNKKTTTTKQQKKQKKKNNNKKQKQVAQRATIAHLSPMCQHPLISNKPASKVIKNLNSFQIRQQLFFQGLVPPMPAV